MASVKKFESKNILKHSVNDSKKLTEKEIISSVIKNFVSCSNEKSRDNKLQKIIKNDNTNSFKYPKFNTSNSNNKNNKDNNSNYINFSSCNSIKNSNVSYMEAKNGRGDKCNKNNFTNTFHFNYEPQKIMHNNENFNNQSQINNNSTFCNNSNINISLKNHKELPFNKIQDISTQNVNKMLYLSTEPEKSEFNFFHANLNPKAIKVFKNKNTEVENKSNKSSNLNVTSLYNNFLRTNSHKNYNTPNTMNNNNQFANTTNQVLINKLKKASFLMNISNKHFYLSNNISNTDISLNNNQNNNNKTNSNSNNKKRNSNGKNIKIPANKNPLTLSNSSSKNINNLKLSLNNIPKKTQSPSPIRTYSSQHEFIEDFFKDLEKYSSSNNETNSNSNSNQAQQQNLNLNHLNILNIFDNLFKKIISGQKPMDTLDIQIKKKLSDYSEVWKKFLLAYEKNSIAANAAKNPNPNYINNIDLSTKNVINHNHNLNSYDAAENENKCSKDPFVSGNHYCALENLKAELDEKFTNMMKTEVNKIKGVVCEKEKIIEELQKEIEIKNFCISEMQETLKNNFKPKDGLVWHSQLFSDNMLKETLQENDLSIINNNSFNKNSDNIIINNNHKNNHNLNINNLLNNNNYINNKSNIKSNNDFTALSNNNLQPILIPTLAKEKSNDYAFNSISNNNILIADNSYFFNEQQDGQEDQSKINNFFDHNNNLNFRENHNNNKSNENNNKIMLDYKNKIKNNNDSATEDNAIENISEPVNEMSLYDQKQFIREKHMLQSENKSLFNKLNEMEKLVNFQKEKEVKLMKVLYYLNKQGIPIDEIIQNQYLLFSEKSEIDEQIISQINHPESNFTPLESSKSMDSLMYLPLTLEKPNIFLKPNVIPVLNFNGINSKFNLEYGSAKTKDSNKNKICITDPSYYNHNNVVCVNNDNNLSNNLIEENYYNDDNSLNFNYGNNSINNKTVVNNNIKHKNNSNHLKKKENFEIGKITNENFNNNTIQNDHENRKLINMLYKSPNKLNSKVNKGLLSKNLQFRNIVNNIIPQQTNGQSENKSQYVIFSFNFNFKFIYSKYKIL